MGSLFQGSPAARRETHTLSREPSSEVIVVDDFYLRPQAVREAALAGQFEDTPGPQGMRVQRVPPSPDLQGAIERQLGITLEGFETKFHLMSQADRDRLRYVHTDGSDWLGVLYLGHAPRPLPGTAFFRHRQTGLSVLPGRLERALLAMSAEKGRLDELKQTCDDAYLRPRWELLLEVPYRFNRLVLFRSTQFHATAESWGRTPGDSRLTQLFCARQKPPSFPRSKATV
jgi:hypothetical protein